jgi:hypothetical protein
MTAIKYVLLAILLCLPSLAQSQAPPQAGGPPQSNSPYVAYVVFIHCGPKKADDPVVKGVAIMLAKKGYSVREPESDQDVVGGPGVDYFDDQSRTKAEDVANAVNDYLGGLTPPQDPARKLKVRRQVVKSSSSTYLGVWLF